MSLSPTLSSGYQGPGRVEPPTRGQVAGDAVQQRSEDTGKPGFKYLFWVLKLDIQKNYIANESVEIKMLREKISTKLFCSKDTFFIG